MGAQRCGGINAFGQGAVPTCGVGGRDDWSGDRGDDIWRQRDIGLLARGPSARLGGNPQASGLAERGGGHGAFGA